MAASACATIAGYLLTLGAAQAWREIRNAWREGKELARLVTEEHRG